MTSTTTEIVDHPRSTAPQLSGLLALARAELLILLRNKTALFTAAAIPLMLVALVAAVPLTGGPTGIVMGMLLGTSVLFVIYYTVVTAVVARREEHTLKRLYSGPLRPGVILLAMAVPLFGMLLAQLAVGVVATALLIGLGDAPRLALLVPAAIAGTLAWWALGLASTTFTRSVEAAQLTTLPLILVALGLSGLSLPLAVLPEPLQLVAQLSPMFPITDLAYLAVGDLRATGEAVGGAGLLAAIGTDLAVLGGWLLVAGLVVRRSFRWEPRR